MAGSHTTSPLPSLLPQLIATMEDLYPHITAALPPPQLIATMEDLFPRDRKDRFCVVEYTLLQGVNDSQEDAERLVKLLAGVRCIVNLIGEGLCSGCRGAVRCIVKLIGEGRVGCSCCRDAVRCLVQPLNWLSHHLPPNTPRTCSVQPPQRCALPEDSPRDHGCVPGHREEGQDRMHRAREQGGRRDGGVRAAGGRADGAGDWEGRQGGARCSVTMA